MLTYNDPNRTKERQEVEPPTPEEATEAVEILNRLIKFTDKYRSVQLYREEMILLQRLIDDYQNKCHYFSVKGGWGQTGDIEVNYEIVKTT